MRSLMLALAMVPTLAYSQTPEKPAEKPPAATAEVPADQAAPAPFSLKPGEALIISPNGSISFVSRLHGEPGQIREMRRRSKSVTKGLVIWADLDGAVSVTEPIQTRAESKERAKPEAKRVGQCNVKLCSSMFASFHASDCTYQPRGGGSRLICQLK